MKKTGKLIGWVIIGCAFVLCFFAVVHNCLVSRNFTEEYSIYNEVKNTSSVDEVKKYLSDKKIEYFISDNMFTLNEYDHISLKIEGTQCHIQTNTVMSSLEALDNMDYGVVVVEGNLTDDKIEESVSLNTVRYYFEKEGNNYFVTDKLIEYITAAIGISLSIVGAIVLVIQANVPSKTK